MAYSSSVNSIRKLKRRREPVALRDLAKLAGVDISTVSRALNRDPRVNDERAEHIRKLADKVGYRPRPLRSKSTRSIGLLMGTSRLDRLDTDFCVRLSWEAERVLAARQMHVNFECVRRDGPVVLPAIVQQNRVDGVLLAGHPPADLVAQIRALSIPAVAINDLVSRLQIDCVRSNPEPALKETMLHLAARGHEAFGLIMGDTSYPTVKARLHSYGASLSELGIVPKPGWLVTELPAEITGGREGIRQLQQRGPLPTTILCENDWFALGAMQELQLQGIRIPEDVSLVGHDDLWVCQQMHPNLTTVHRAEEELVSKAIDLLLAQVENGIGEPREVLVEGKMVWRQSTGPAPIRLKAQRDDAKS